MPKQKSILIFIFSIEKVSPFKLRGAQTHCSFPSVVMGATSHSSCLSFPLIRISEKQSRAKREGEEEEEIKSPAWLWQERQDLL